MTKILVVDDEPVILSLVREMLGNIGEYEVFDTLTGVMALEIVKRESIDIAIVDVRLAQGEDGMIVLKEIKKYNSAIKVVMMTLITTDKSFEVGAYKHGASDYIYKPFSIDDLEKAMKKL